MGGRSEIEASGRRELLLDLLRDSPQPRSILSLAEQLGVHVNTVRFHLDAMLRAGQVEQLHAAATGPGRPPLLFQAARRMDPSGPTSYRVLATMLTSYLATSSPDPATTSTEIGRVWGAQLLGLLISAQRPSARVKRGEALAYLTGILRDLGFAPEPPTGSRDSTIRLRHCPFLGLVTGTDTDTDTGDGYGEVICSLHLGLMQGALAALRGPVTVDRLEPFVQPDLCTAHLVPVATTNRDQPWTNP